MMSNSIDKIKKIPFNLFISFLLLVNGTIFVFSLFFQSIKIFIKTLKIKFHYLPGMQNHYNR